MGKKRKLANEETEKRKKLLKSFNERMSRFQRAMKGNVDALVECMYEGNMCSKEDLNDYYNTSINLDKPYR